MAYFEGYDIKYKGPDSMDPLSFKYYDKDRVRLPFRTPYTPSAHAPHPSGVCATHTNPPLDA